MSDFEKQHLITSSDEKISYSNCKQDDQEEAVLSTSGATVTPQSGLTVFKCAVFIFSSITGSGVLALPFALSNAGWSGIFLLLFVCIMSGYCGVVCGKCWMIVRKNKPNIDYTRDPFPAIGHAAAGNVGYVFTEISVILSLMGVSIVFLILGSQQFVSIIDKSFDNVSKVNELRIAIFICGFVLVPFQWLGTSKDIASFIVGASVCTAIASFLIIYESIIILNKNGFPEVRREVSGESFFMAFGTIAFTFGGGTLFPSFQADMQKPSKFPLALVLGFIGVLFIYLPAALLPFLVIGEPDVDIMISLKSNVAIDHKYVLTIAQCLISIHILSTIVLVNNPIALQIEEHLKIPHGTGWKRILVRTSVALVLTGIAILFPHLGPVITIVGACTVSVVSFILPVWFYMKLNNYNVPLHIKVLHFEIIIVAGIFGSLGIYSGVVEMTKQY